MKCKLREFPVGAIVRWQDCEWLKKPCEVKDHFILESLNGGMLVYLHRDTFVEPPIVNQ